MKEPKFSDFLVRVGGLGVIYVIAILMTNVFFPNYVNYVIFAITFVVIGYMSIKSWFQRKKTTRTKRNSRGD